jgi:hypothetical protein
MHSASEAIAAVAARASVVSLSPVADAMMERCLLPVVSSSQSFCLFVSGTAWA